MLTPYSKAEVTETRPAGNRKLEYIDALRGIAVLCVLMVHIVGAMNAPQIYKSTLGLGAKGVQLFFFVSAFTLFLSGANRRNNETSPNRNFFIRRFFRIAPLYYLGILYYYFQSGLFSKNFPDYHAVLLNLSFLHSLSPTYINTLVPGGWSIGVEMLFYFMVPFLIVIIKNINHAAVFLFFTLVLRYVFFYFFKENPFNFNKDLWENFIYWFLPNQMPCFAFGIIFFFLQHEFNNEPLKFKLRLFQYFLLVALAAIFKLLKIDFFNNDFYVLLIILPLAFYLSRYPVKLFVNGFTKLAGKLSFSMYIIHFAVILILHQFNIFDLRITPVFLLNFLILYLIVCSITMFISKFSFDFVELNSQKMGKKLLSFLDKKEEVKPANL